MIRTTLLLSIFVVARCAPRAHGADPLPPDAPVDARLQRELETIDARVRAELGIAPDDRAFGIHDINDGRVAWLRPDVMFYGASVPKICILLAWFEAHPDPRIAPGTRRELELMIKRSSNEMAAKYSQAVGLEFLQSVEERYGFYDREHGGGLWSGKHYGLDDPRRGDPLQDLSHAATVRQCLRFYALLERGELVSPAASRRMIEIFQAPDLDFWNSGFVRGLTGRDVELIRKSGLWEDWHLDSARVVHGSRRYVIAGLTRSPRGDDYLARLAADVDGLLCGAPVPRPLHHELWIDEPAPGPVLLRASGGEGDSLEHVSSVHLPSRPFNEVLPSWNLDLDAPESSGAIIELRVGGRADDSWTPWLRVGDWGTVPGDEAAVVTCDDGEVLVDFFRSPERRFDRAQYRVRLRRAGAGDAAIARLHRFALTTSDTTRRPLAVPRPERSGRPRLPSEASLDVPYFSQRAEDPAIAGRICSPTSVAMVLAHRGVTTPVAAVARRAYDAAHDLYGNWPRAVQTAWTFGIPGHVTRFSDWDDVRATLASGQPIIASIRVLPGQLTGAPYRETSGHLLVLRGYRGDDEILVNDAAAPDASSGAAAYSRRELDVVWLARGGTAYVLLPPR